MRKHWLVVGASSTIAKAFARIAATRGDVITLVGRDLNDLTTSGHDLKLRGAHSVRTLRCDVRDPIARADCLQAASVPETILNVFLAVGDMPNQEDMDSDPDLLVRMTEATYVGPIALLQGLAPLLERQESGSIIVLGSVAGDRGRRKNYLYGSAKAGLATYTEGLRSRLFHAGVSVTLVKPGFIDTAMTWGLPGLFLVASPQDCAAAIFRAADRGREELYYPRFWKLVMFIIRHIPAALMKRLSF